MTASTSTGELSLVMTSCLGTSRTSVRRSSFTTWLISGHTMFRPWFSTLTNLPSLM